MDRASAAQALAECDQLEQGVKEGNPEVIKQVRDLLRYWAGGASENEIANVSLAMRQLMLTASEGNIEDLLMALKASRKLAEAMLDSCTGEQHEAG